MTNKEAIKRLSYLDWYFQRQNDYSERDHDAFLLAIKALEINEQYGGEIIQDNLQGWRYEPKKGKWIREDKPWGGFGDRVLVLTCSACGESFIYRRNNPKFCSECGSRMEADNDDTRMAK